ncbi:mechanosensitive ion channel family protein [Phormidesmis priestleyi ULC007]|uniref:Mechanosensitive ion channel family protein n=1 Tax=Phormidesmis priestleyi ULC007 TaxID=1920490 RepID=A0A2T1DFT2_9CYAN|nr:mechanosensitive ion channel family protein [Phormidesmis priestleyi]PSB19317.1 mechanosensitive ion channel family protein [Phormidesmis priestleyi ULC007]PZO52202.1 MAG: mechanosensitive ion channel family protein [Phormidesmis priestleyi]
MTRQKTIATGIGFGFAIALLFTTISSAQSPTTPSLPQLTLPQLTSPQTVTSTELARGEVKLDGRKLFTIAAPAVRNQQNGTPITARAQNIETNLNRIVDRNLDPNQLQVTTAIDSASNLPIISVNDQYLMTVTTLDAQLQGQEPSSYAKELTQTIRNALIEAKRERQSDFLVRQCAQAAGVGVVMFLTSWVLSRWQRRVIDQQRQRQTEIPADPIVSPNTAESANVTTSQIVQQQMIKRQQRNLREAQRRLLQLTQVGIWGIGILIILGLFPYTRWLQPIVFSTPLKILGIAIVTYLAIRLGDVVIDRFFSALSDGEVSSPQASQRIALRVSTFSVVVKSLSAIAFISIAMIAILSVTGIEVVPLLAGAGIIGLGISLASQNLIKDVINGFLILLEDQYAVGDVIQVGKASGLVEHMNLRITQLRNAEGRLITIPNSSIAIVENLSKDWARVDLAIVISYDANLDQAIHIIKQVGHEMDQAPDWQAKILEPPEMLGVDDLNNAGVTIRVWIKTQPLQQWNVGREFRRRLKLAMDEQDIAIGISQQSLPLRSAAEDRAFDGGNHSPDQNNLGGGARSK